MAKGDAKRERLRRRLEFEEQIANLVGLEGVGNGEVALVANHLESIFSSSQSCMRATVRVLNYIKENGIGELL